MLGVATAELGAHLGVGTAPEPGQVTGDLYRSTSGRQQRDHDRHAPAGETRGVVPTEGVLEADRHQRICARVVDGATLALRRGDVRRRELVDSRGKRSWYEVAERGRDVDTRQIAAPANIVVYQRGKQPLVETPEQ